MSRSTESEATAAPADTLAPPAVLATKLHAPRRRDVLRRGRLVELVAGRDLPALTLVSAGAGFGKTTLAAEWFAGRPGTAWLSLDRRDSDPVRFWTYVVAAIHTACPGVVDTARTLLGVPHPSVSGVVTALLNDLHGAAGEVVLVLDDYHAVESAEIHEALASCIEHLPPQLRIVITSRADPPLPLAALRARGELLEVRAAELRFTDDETAAYLGTTTTLELRPEQVGTLAARTEGWIAALKLAALSMEGRDDVGGFVAEFAGNDRFILDYLVGEVLDRQEDEVRRFLLETSILARLSGPLCDAVTQRPGGRSMLERLERANLFLVPLDDRRTWYRYHHLFADVLRARLTEEGSAVLAELHLRASEWFEEHDDPDEAIAHALAGAHVERAARLVELHAPLVRSRRQEAVLRGWLEALPPELFANRPVLAIHLVGARMATGDPSGVELLLELVESAMRDGAVPRVVHDDQEYRRLPAQLLVYRAALALLDGALGDTVTYAAAALELVDDRDDLRRGSATALLALAHWAAGDLAAAEQRYVEAIDALARAGHLGDALGCSLALADIQIAGGRLRDATRTLEAGLRWTDEHPGLRGAADMHAGLSEVLIERDDLDAAERHLHASRELGELAGLPQHAYRWRVTAARLARARGDLDTALALIDEAAPLYDTDFSPPVRPVAAMRARVLLARGDVDEAVHWAAEAGLDAGDELAYVREFEHITLARVLIARSSGPLDRVVVEDATGLLARLLDAARAGGRAGSMIEILVLLATAHHARGDRGRALTSIREALLLSEAEGHVRLFLHAGPAVTSLLRSVAADRDATDHTRRVAAAASRIDARPPSAPPSAAGGPVLVGELSDRELDVLRLLRSELSGPEIAAELVVSLNTVRTHTKNIYAKLGVNSRRAAVRRAAELGL